MSPRFGDWEHLARVAGLFLAGLVVFLVLKAVFVPAGFGVYGHFRAGALDDNRARPLTFAGQTACAECHSDVVDLRKTGKHAGVSCEACHGPHAGHAADPSTTAARRPDAATLCLVCHTANVAKPRGFPRIVVEEHAGSESCLTCHTAHKPEAAPEAKP
jgi:predicted CXXCH cytochrome family protein